jgi:murein DD-endopeptidase MepM/ murein hydrolase activator NlpD
MDSEQRRIVTRQRGRRLGWPAAIGVAVPLFGMVAAFGTVPNAPEPVPAQRIVERLDLPGNLRGDAASGAYYREDRFSGDDTLAALLGRLGSEAGDVVGFLRSAQAMRAFRLLRPGTTVQAKVSEDGKLYSVWFLTGRNTLISIDRLGDGFAASEQIAELERDIDMKSGEITSSLFAATDGAGIPDNVAVQLADIFAGDIDFQRDLRRGDRFTVVFETEIYGGRAVRAGRVLAAEVVNQKKTFRAVWYQETLNRGGYYAPDGSNLRKAFLRTPLEYSRITSGFGIRRHPILQQWRNHSGVDYGAPVGTRVRATGDGIVESVGRQGGYGNLIVLRHNGGFSTYYAHLSGYARGIRRGARIAQGDVIGYVGQTGWATGPHLHYEFRFRNQYRNPLTMAFPSGRPIPDDERIAFSRTAAPLVARLDLLRNSNLALLE